MNDNIVDGRISFSIYNSPNSEFTWDSGLTIFFGLSGESIIFTDRQQSKIHPAGMLVVNPFELFRVDCETHTKVIALHIPRTYLQLAAPNASQIQLLCYCGDDNSGSNDCFDKIRMQYAHIFHDFFQNQEKNKPRMTRTIIEIVAELIENFSVPNDLQTKYQETTAKRIKRILSFIHEHWQENISLADLAEQEYLSANHLSRFFQKQLNATFTEYITGIRLQYAQRMLVSGNESVTKIAYECGFKNINSFIEYFRQRYDATPGQYRLEYQKSLQMQIGGQKSNQDAEDMAILLRYIKLPVCQQVAEKTETQIINFDARVDGISLMHTWKRLINIGYARDGLLAPIQKQILRAQEEIGFEYIRFHGIFDEDMRIYHENEQGELKLDFTYIDLLFDFICSVGLKPYIELGFMPKILAKEECCFFDRVSYMSTFNNAEKWRMLIIGTLKHLIERYGRDAVRQWKFTTMAINFAMLGHMSYEDFYEHYSVSYTAVKEVDCRFQFGGPGGFSSAIWDNRCMENFLDYCQSYKCMPDFFCTQCYPHRSIEHDSEFMIFTVSQDFSPSVLSRDEHFTATMIRDFRKLLQKYDKSESEIWIEEWNSTLWQRDLSSDTSYKSAWLIKNICENYDQAAGFGYWLLTDLIEERAALGGVFHGGYGLFTYNGIPKAGWHAMNFANRLGDTAILQGEGYFVTRTKNGIQILLNHYCHYDNLYRYRYQVLENPGQAYDVFIQKQLLRFVFDIEGLDNGIYRIQEYTIDKRGGSAFDKWVEIGAPQYMQVDELQYLTDMSKPAYHVREQTVEGTLHFETVLYPHGTQLIVFTRLERDI